MKNFLSKTKITLAIVVLAFILAPIFTNNVMAKEVACGPLNPTDKAICEASLEACGRTDSAKDKACRDGFREGAKSSGQSKSDACKGYRGSEKTECQKGHDKGSAQKSTLNSSSTSGGGKATSFPGDKGSHQCGNLKEDGKNVKTKINFGCLGDSGPQGMGPIEDLFYALIRFLSNGVGVAMVIALIAAGIMYTTSEGNAEQTIKAKKRIQNIVLALFIYLFIYAIIQFLVPGGVFK